nr:SHOCT domain-containing protein [Methylocapsa aurea]
MIAMQEFSPEGLRIVDETARRHGVSSEAVATLLRALALGNGVQAQFNHPDLGGMGQWSQGGMIMVGDMFNQGLKYRVDRLCSELADLLRAQPLFEPRKSSQSQSQHSASDGVSLFISGAASGQWWPDELGAPAATGAQNDLRYAFFPASRRLAIQHDGRVSVHDAGDHQITGFSQQQGGDQSLTFTSQYGLVRVADLPLVSPGAFSSQADAGSRQENTTSQGAGGRDGFGSSPSTPAPQAPASAAPARQSADDIFTMIERLADLRQKNILTEEEFAAKKAELLSRL